MKNAEISEKLVGSLGLRYEPVAVKVIRKGEMIPDGFTEPENNIRHCQSIMRSRKGESFLIPASKHACVVGASSLGILPTPEKVVAGDFHANIGMFGCADAAAAATRSRRGAPAPRVDAPGRVPPARDQAGLRTPTPCASRSSSGSDAYATRCRRHATCLRGESVAQWRGQTLHVAR